jgi:hypothetical protein
MTTTRKKVPLWLRFIIFNFITLVFCVFTGRLKFDRPSIIGAVVAFSLMNLVAWISSRHYKEWK